MKEKIFQLLKREYAHLGLSDEILMAQAESLDGLGLVTDENLSTIVASQKTFLEKLQKANDGRVDEAVKTARSKAKKEFEAEEARKKAEEEKRLAEEQAKKEKEGAMPEWYVAEKAANEKILNELMNANKKQKADYEAIIKENEEMKAERARDARNSFIASKAKELGIPEWRVKEGFVIASDADESTITEKLTEVANNCKANILPSGGRAFPMSDNKPDSKELDSIAQALIP